MLRNLYFIFNEKQIAENTQQALWRYYYNKLSKAVDIGWSENFQIDDKDLVSSLKASIAEFSAFKETAFRKDLEELLTQGDRLLPWSEFKKEDFKVSGDYNARWLETEYHQTIANANAAAQWKNFKRNADVYPNLKLVSVRDARVRPEHKALDGTIRPLDDPFWDNHLPPLDWGCRCHVEQTDQPTTEIKGVLQLKLEFENNPAKTGKIFGGTVYQSRISKEEEKKAKTNAKKWLEKENMTKENQQIKYSREEQKKKDKEILSWFSTKVKRGKFISIVAENLKNEVRISKSNIKYILDHIKEPKNKEIAKDIEQIIENAFFSHYLPLDKSKSSKNYGKKVGRGVVGYHYYLTEWKGKKIEINMEIIHNRYEQPYAIVFKDKKE